MSSTGRHIRLAQRASRRRRGIRVSLRQDPWQIRCSWDGAVFCEDSATPEERERAHRKRLKRWNRAHPHGQPRPRWITFAGAPPGEVGRFWFDDEKPLRSPKNFVITGIA